MSRRTKRRRWFRRLAASERPVVRTMARSLSRGDKDFAEDLEQEGLLAIYLMAPETLDRAGDAQMTAREAAFRAMKRYRRRAGLRRPCEEMGEFDGWMVITPRQTKLDKRGERSAKVRGASWEAWTEGAAT